jgi:hypothetical protein
VAWRVLHPVLRYGYNQTNTYLDFLYLGPKKIVVIATCTVCEAGKLIESLTRTPTNGHRGDAPQAEGKLPNYPFSRVKRDIPKREGNSNCKTLSRRENLLRFFLSYDRSTSTVPDVRFPPPSHLLRGESRGFFLAVSTTRERMLNGLEYASFSGLPSRYTDEQRRRIGPYTRHRLCRCCASAIVSAGPDAVVSSKRMVPRCCTGSSPGDVPSKERIRWPTGRERGSSPTDICASHLGATRQMRSERAGNASPLGDVSLRATLEGIKGEERRD